MNLIYYSHKNIMDGTRSMTVRVMSLLGVMFKNSVHNNITYPDSYIFVLIKGDFSVPIN